MIGPPVFGDERINATAEISLAIPATVNRQTAPRVRLLLLNIGALICALALLMGRWSPARLFDDQTWDDVPWYLDLRPVLVVFGC